MEAAFAPSVQGSFTTIMWMTVVLAIFNFLLFAGLVAFIIVAVREFGKLRSQLQPIIDRVNPILEEARPLVASVKPVVEDEVKPILGNVKEITRQASGVVADVGSHAREIAEKGEETVNTITRQVENTSHLVTEQVSQPVIRIAGFAAGVTRAIRVLRSAGGHDGEKDPYPLATGQ